MLVLLIQGVLALVVTLFGVYVLLEIRSTHRAKNAPSHPTAGEESAFLPPVSVLLPVYNEAEVAAALVDAVCSLRYPPEKLDILALDDSSTDATRAILAERVAWHRQRGVNIRHARRESRIGYKAGNLSFGLELAQGDFIAIFDADCLPPADFLLKTMPCFQDERVGFLQTGVEYRNRRASFLTCFQAVEAGHKEDVTTGLSLDESMASLTGSSCVWRRSCIQAIGGVSAETITEDVDMGYRAQLQAWNYVFLGSVVSTAELPESMGSFRVQRHRWACGLIHNAALHLRRMCAARMGLLPRLNALALMFSSLLLALVYVLVLLTLPFACLTSGSPGPFFNFCCTAFLAFALLWAWNNMAGALEPDASLKRKLVFACGYVIMFFPLGLYYFCAALEVGLGVKNAFHRTPKGRKNGQKRHPRVNARLIALEVLSFLYSLTALLVSLARDNFWVAFFSLLAASGFALVLFLSWREEAAKR